MTMFEHYTFWDFAFIVLVMAYWWMTDRAA
jgi:hypothetical protein